MQRKTKKSQKRIFFAKNPMLLFGYGALCLALSLVGQYLGRDAANSAFESRAAVILSGAGQLSFLLFGVFLYRLHTADLREEKRSALLYFGRFAAAVGFLVSVRAQTVFTFFWNGILLLCLALLAIDAHARGEKTGLLCLPAAVCALFRFYFSG